MHANQRFLRSVTTLAGAVSLGVGLVVGATTTAIAAETQSATSVPLQLAQTSSVGDIVDVAAGNDNFDTLVQAVQAADLVDTLKGEGPFTVFAPTDAAFAELPDSVLNALLLPENQDLLTEVLTYHVVPGEVMSDDLETGVVDTLNGGVAVRVAPDGVVVNNASVIMADVPADNGVIHAINRVLIPTGLVEELQARMVEDEEDEEPIRALW